ncbi:MAG: PilZ domain-containing protein [Proteobacteria bacterium]|nr:PilZ domain-containing protein [Pseudomonadota bacterium]
MRLDKSGAESRTHERKPVMRRGVVVHEESGKTFSCTIVDLSLAGARLQLFAPDLPDRNITLVDRETGSLQQLRIVWRAGPMVGVAFVEPSTAAADSRHLGRPL